MTGAPAIDTTLLILLVLACLLILALAVFVFLTLRKSRKPTPLLAAPGDDAGLARQRSAGLAASFANAMAALRDLVPERRFQYRVPWVLMIGESGSGKTTLLDQLAAAAADAAAPTPSAGIRWRFLEGGAVVDVPGDFLLGADGKEAKDGRWDRLLRLLVRHRANRPLDSVVLVIPAPELLAGSGETQAVQQAARGAAIRAKLDEAQRVLGLALPVYVLVTKCDHVRGFHSFCWELDPELDDDMFGWSNPNTLETAYNPAWLDQAFEDVLDGIQSQQLRMYAGGSALHSADGLFLFPFSLQCMREPLRQYLSQIFRETAYGESNFLRGIYFCGDEGGSEQRPAPSPAAEAGVAALAPAHASATPAPPVMPAVAPVTFEPQIVFARHLFSFKVFFEYRIAQPVGHTLFSRNRTLLAAQALLLVFVLLFGIGTFRAYIRLRRMETDHFVPLLNYIEQRLQPDPGSSTPATVPEAYNLVDVLGTINAKGFRSFFFPASWRDPVNENISGILVCAFETDVYQALREGLETKANGLIGNCDAAPATGIDIQQDFGPFAPITVAQDPEYRVLRSYIDDFSELTQNIRAYDDLRGTGAANVRDLSQLFLYLDHKKLSDESRYASNPYFLRAMQEAQGSAVTVKSPRGLNACGAIRTRSLIHNFFNSWLDQNNPLPAAADQIREQIENLRQGKLRTTSDLLQLVADIRRLDAVASGGSFDAIKQSSFDRNVYPALGERLASLPFADANFLEKVDDEGRTFFDQLKTDLFSEKTDATGPILELRSVELHVSGPVMALALGLDSLLGQDFMTEESGFGALDASRTHFLWNKQLLTHGAQLQDGYAKWMRDRLPALPSDLQEAVEHLAQTHLASAMASIVARAQQTEPAGALDAASTLYLEIRSFNDAGAQLTQLEPAVSLPGAGAAGHGTTLSLVVNTQSADLLNRLNQLFNGAGAYQSASADDRQWDGAQPLTLISYGAHSAAELDSYLAQQYDQVKSMALDYADPLYRFLAAQNLPQPSTYARWSAIIGDVKDYEAKKPGNPIAALESFIRTDLDKIGLAGGCQAADAPTRGQDYFLLLRASLRNAAVNRCGALLLSAYNTEIAQFFNQRLAGKFPFGPLPDRPGAAEADPRDTAEFLARVGQRAAALTGLLAHNAAYASVLAFVEQADAVRQMFAGGLPEGAPFADVGIQFRVNRPAEVNGDQIIEWSVATNGQTARYPGPVEGLRWHYGSPLRVMLRYAKDSPYVPAAGGASGDAAIADRTVTYNYPDAWSLFTLLRRHAGLASDFAESPEEAANTLRFAIPSTADRAVTTVPAGTSIPDTRVYLGVTFSVAGTKEPRAVPIATFPSQAPGLPATATTTE